MPLSNLHAEWTYLGDTKKDGHKFYLDYDRIRKVGDSIYVWQLINFSKASQQGIASIQSYYECDCKLFRIKLLTSTSHALPMAEDYGSTYTFENPKWTYPTPETMNEIIFKELCKHLVN